jgi:CRP/FNR family transcriptional regulator, cyclic AMP receptor protein
MSMDGHGERRRPDRGRDETYVRIFDADPALLRDVEPEQAAFLREHGAVPAVRLDPGPWHPPTHRSSARRWLGLLVVAGFCVRPLEIAGRRVSEVVGPGDLLRPWDDEAWPGPARPGGAWTVLCPATIGVLDQAFAAVARRSPELIGCLLERSLRRAHNVAAGVAIAEEPDDERRVRALLDCVVDRWGRGRAAQLSDTALAVASRTDVPTVAHALQRSG